MIDIWAVENFNLHLRTEWWGGGGLSHFSQKNCVRFGKFAKVTIFFGKLKKSIF